MSKPVIRAEKLTKTLSGEVPVTLVREVDIAINEGEFVVIIGASGSGKSSLLYLLGLLDKPSAGKIELDGVDVSSRSENELAEIRLKKLGFVFQFHFLLPEFSALENVMLPMQRLGELSQSAIRKRAEELLDSLGLAEQMHKLPKQLSGGQSQRVAIARALANNPQVILADEPTGNLDSASSGNVQQILRNLVTQHGRSVVVVTHDPKFTEFADRVITVEDGRAVE